MNLRTGIRSILFFYESRIASWTAVWLGFLYWPLYQLLKKRNVCFVINIAGGTGHILCELDLFFRLQNQGKIDSSKRYVWIRKNDPFSSICVKHYRKFFSFATASYFLYELLLPLTIRFKDITLDCGLSGLQWQLDEKRKYIRPIAGQNYLNLISLAELTPLWNRYFRLRSLTREFFPLVVPDIPWDGLGSLLGVRDRKRVLVHIKEGRGNATAVATDPNTYLTALQHFHSQGIQLVFVGREKMPSCFRDFGMINYAQSPVANFEHDIAIFQSCRLAIIGGSGIAYLADCFNKPYLYINSWHIGTPVYSPLAVIVPALLQDKFGRFLTFREQIDLFLTTQPDGTVPELKQYSARNAASDEILDAVHELEELIETPKPKSSLQNAMANFGENMPIHFAASRFSDAFLKKYQHLMEVS